MRVIKRIRNLLRWGSFVPEITSETGKANSYLLALARGEGGKRDPELAKKLSEYTQELDRKRKAYWDAQKQEGT